MLICPKCQKPLDVWDPRQRRAVQLGVEAGTGLDDASSFIDGGTCAACDIQVTTTRQTALLSAMRDFHHRQPDPHAVLDNLLGMGPSDELDPSTVPAYDPQPDDAAAHPCVTCVVTDCPLNGPTPALPPPGFACPSDVKFPTKEPR